LEASPPDKEIVRKIRKVGRDQAFIEIPQEWLKDQNLTFGDYVILSLKVDALLINKVVAKALGVKKDDAART
jgi:antitoxin component of MazEF toxin-antitoxin module